jgi:hypothetical protein
MNVTLRKAHALSKGLLEQVKKLPLARTMTLSVYGQDDPDGLVEDAGDNLLANVEVGRKLIQAATAIRLLIGGANKQVGIDALLSEKAQLDAVEKLLARVVNDENDYEFAQAAEPAIARAKLDAIMARNKTAGERHGVVTEQLTVKVATGDLVSGLADELATIRRRKAEIADELLSRNSAATLSLDATTVALLKSFKLI